MNIVKRYINVVQSYGIALAWLNPTHNNFSKNEQCNK